METKRKEHLIKEIEWYDEASKKAHNLMIYDSMVAGGLLLLAGLCFDSIFRYDFATFQKAIVTIVGLSSTALSFVNVGNIMNDFVLKYQYLIKAEDLSLELETQEAEEDKVLKIKHIK